MWIQRSALVALLLACSGLAQAHFVWIERDGGADAKAYFGEWAQNLRERDDGHLKMLASPRAFAAGRDLKIERGADHLLLKNAGSGDVRLLEEVVYGKNLIVYHIKNGRAETAAALDLELVPVSAGGNRFTLLFRGEPVTKTEVTVFGPPQWQKSFYTDAQGQLTIDTPWAGFYVLEAAHEEPKAGNLDGKPYEKTRHITTLSFTATQGIAWPSR